MSDDELSYLQPGFDLSSLTVPRLRAILVSHDIPYPASAKKPQLIQLLTDEVLPRSRKLLSARARTKRTSKGITDMPSSQESSTIAGDDDHDGELMPPPPPPKTPRGRKSKATLAAEAEAAAAAAASEEEEPPATPVTARTARTPGGRKSTAKHPRASDTETEADKPRPSARKTRKSTPGPVPVPNHPSIKIDEPDLRAKRESLDSGASPFSDDNPFQSGSSPVSEARRVSSTSRTRKSLGAHSAEGRKSTSSRRQTSSSLQGTHEDDFSVPSRSTFEFPVPRIKSEKYEPEEIPTTEEFTPEENLELARDRAAKGYSARESLPGRSTALVRRKKKKPASTVTKYAPASVLITLLGALGAWYRKEKIDIGFCGVGKPSWSLAENPQIPVWVTEKFQPVCEPCPQHAYCYPGMEVSCEPNYVLRPHPLSLGGTIPLPPTCEPDGEKVKKIKAVADRAVEELRERRAVYECGDGVKDSAAGSSATSAEVRAVVKSGQAKLEIAEEDLKKEVGKQRRKGMTAEEFEELWQGALGDITEREEVDVVRDG
jgi:hypothetical protein